MSAEGIDCEIATCSASFAPGTPVTLHGSVSDWTGDCVGTVSRCTFVADAPIDVKARGGGNVGGATSSYGITVSVSGRGRVTAGAQVVCDGPGGSKRKCNGRFKPNARVTLVAKARPGFRFQRWRDDDCKRAGRNPRCTLQAYAPTLKLRAVFNGS